jgi:signal transduction histidine kinase
VVSDYRLPRFSAPQAIEMLQSSGTGVPLVVVSGFVGEEVAAGLVRSGASTFVTKANLERLPGAIETAMREAQLVREREAAQAEVLRSREQLRELTDHLDRGREEERAAISREIHDELGVLLTAAKIEIATLERELAGLRPDLGTTARSVETLLDQAMTASRLISRRLRPAILDHGVVAAVEWQARDFSKRLGIQCDLRLEAEDIDLPPESATAVFRIFQEALTNIARHAGARRIGVRLAVAEGVMLLVVKDDGRGIAAGDQDKHGTFGLRGMRERCRGIGAQIEIRRPEGGGTELSLRVPVRSAYAAAAR